MCVSYKYCRLRSSLASILHACVYLSSCKRVSVGSQSTTLHSCRRTQRPRGVVRERKGRAAHSRRRAAVNNEYVLVSLTEREKQPTRCLSFFVWRYFAAPFPCTPFLPTARTCTVRNHSLPLNLLIRPSSYRPSVLLAPYLNSHSATQVVRRV